VIARIPDEVLISINSLEILGIIYLAIAVSKLRERISHMEGRYAKKEKENNHALETEREKE
jgi:hypothetical protein